MNDLRPCGWVPDPHEARGAIDCDEIRRGIGAPADIPLEGELPGIAWHGLYQEGESCTGHLGAAMIYDLSGTKTSPYMAWFYGRAHDRRTTIGLTDVGVSSWAMQEALRKHGSCPIEMWSPETPGFDPHIAPPALARLTAQRYNLKLVSMRGFGDELVEATCAAIHAGRPVGVVVEVDEAFSQYRGAEVIPARSGNVRGLHIVEARAYRTVDGERQVQVLNWWRRWGAADLGWLSADRIKGAPHLCVAMGVS